MTYEYKVVRVESFDKYKDTRMMMQGWAPAQEIEDAINEMATEGWEYYNPIVLPYTTDGKYLCHTALRLVFRREK
jgi:hypothetical protein